MQDFLYEDFFAIVARLEERGVPYAVVGGIAMAFHDQPRYTKDMDFLVPEESVEPLSEILVALGYFESGEPWTFSSTNLMLRRFMKTIGPDYWFVDLLIGSEPRHLEIVKRAVVDEDADVTVRLARREDLIWMKSLRNSDQDQVDIKRLRHEPNPPGDAGTQ